jgi:hypothetical protein
MDALPMPVDVSAGFDRTNIEDALRLPGQEVDFKVVPGGRELKGPLAPDSSAPFFRIEEKVH